MRFMFECIPSPEHPCPNYNNVRMASASKYQKHCAQWDDIYVLSGSPDAKAPRVVGHNACDMQLLIARAQKKPDYDRCVKLASPFDL